MQQKQSPAPRHSELAAWSNAIKSAFPACKVYSSFHNGMARFWITRRDGEAGAAVSVEPWSFESHAAGEMDHIGGLVDHLRERVPALGAV